ncbi:MAG: hypothetical protein ACJAR4_001500 [Psychroserpens sp.]|jgi:hypothetical protein
MERIIDETNTSKNFNGFGDDLFKIIPGIEKATKLSVVKASELNKKKFYKDWVSKNKPCLIKNAVKHWPATQKFKNYDYWLSACENFDMTIFPHMNHMVKELQQKNIIETTFYDALKRLFKNQDFILNISRNTITENNKFSKLIKEMPDFSFLSNESKPRRYPRRRFFMYRRASTAWHYHDLDETLMCQINGRKKVVLFSPKTSNVKIISKFLIKERYLEGEVLDDNLSVDPLIAYVEEGDALYIPPYWLHGVAAVDGEIGFTLAHCWSSPIHILGNFSNYFVRKLHKNRMWPINIYTFTTPFIGLYAWILHLINKVKA